MKKIVKKFGLSLAAVACVACAGVGVSLSSSESATKASAATVAESDFWVSSTGIRLVNDANGAGIRFHTNVTKDVYGDIIESGTLIIPEVRCDGELTLDDLNNADERTRPVQVVTKDANTDLWYSFEYTNEDGTTEDVKRSTVYLYDIPASSYGARMVAVSYVTTAEGTTYTEIPSATSIADVASRVGESSDYYTQSQPYVVDKVKVTYNMPDGSTQAEEVAYGSTLKGPTYDKNAYAVSNATDQYGKAVNFATYNATLPVTIDVKMETLMNENVVLKNVYAGGYNYNEASENKYFTWDSWTAGATTGAPEGFSNLYKLDWYSAGTGWKAGANHTYRNLYSDADLSDYSIIRFAIKMGTDGDAALQLPNNVKYTNQWLFVELVQSSANFWNVTITLEDGTEAFKYDGIPMSVASDATANYSMRNLLFSGSWPTWSNGKTWASLIRVLSPNTTDYTASVYTTEVLGYSETTYVPDANAITASSSVLIGTPSNWNWIQPSDVAAAVDTPAGFDSVNAYESFTADNDKWILAGHTRPTTNYNYWASSVLNEGAYDATDLSNYEEVWFALKLINAQITFGAGLSASAITGTTAAASDWAYFHLTQNDDATWEIEVTYKNAVYLTASNQVGNTAKTLLYDGGYSSTTDGGAIMIYQYSSTPSYIYSTEVRGILKDGVTPPSTDTTEFDPEIPADRSVIRTYTWRDDKYALSSSTTETAPKGYSNVVEFNWLDNPSNWSENNKDMPFTCIPTEDLSGYSDVYFAMKYVHDTGKIYNRGGSAYTGNDWLYVHLTQDTSTGTWSVSAKSPDGTVLTSNRTSTATTLQQLLNYENLGLYPNKVVDEATKAIIYFTEMLGVPKAAVSQDRVLWSAVDGAIPTNDLIGRPVDYNATYKYENFTMDKFAAYDLSNTIYQEISFAMLADCDFTFTRDYRYAPAVELDANASTTIMSNTGSRGAMYVVNLSKNSDGTWTVSMSPKRWFSVTINNSKTTEETFTATVSGNSIKEIMSKILTAKAGMTLYVTEVRGTHAHASTIKSLGNGYLQEVCSLCGEVLADPVEFDHNIPEEVVEVNDSIWRDSNYALSTPDQVAPAGFNNIEMYRWNLNSVIVNGIPYGSNNKDMPLTCLDEADVSGYDEVWFAMKNVGGTGFYVRGGNSYTGGDWLYFHLVKVDGTWTLSLSSPDGYVANNVQTGIVGNTLKDILSYNASSESKPWNGGAYPTKAEGDTTTDVKIYFTEILGVISCTHEGYDVNYVSNGDGTHNEVCANCNTVLNANVACSGGEASCTSGAICSVCGTEYGEAIDHTAVWKDNSYACRVCGNEVGSVTTNPAEVTDVALFTDATYAASDASATGAFDATVATPANINISGFVSGLTISNVANVALDGVPYAVSSYANNVLTIDVIPYNVFGEYTLTATITVESENFDVEMPILVITDLITSNAGLLNVRKVLRGQDLTTPATATVKSSVYAGYGNNGGVGTMNGTGYYKLGADISLSSIVIGAHNKTYYANVVYVLGTKALPFTGTFDGAGHILSNFKAVGSAWMNSASTGGYTYMAQDLSDCTETSEGVTMEQEGSFFGFVDGLVKNVAFTNAKFGQYGNIMIGGAGVMEDVYVGVAHIQSPRDGDVAGTNAISQIVAPFAHRASGTNLTMRNFVIDLNDASYSGDQFTINTHYPALIGNGLGAAQNVAVYGFDTSWIDGTLGNVYVNGSDGSAAGIYVEYRKEGTTNGATFRKAFLNDNVWKIVDGVPYLKNVTVQQGSTVTDPSASPTEGSAAYNFAWNDSVAGAFDAIQLINNTTNSATNTELGAQAPDLTMVNGVLTAKQVIVGTYETYSKYITGAPTNYDGTNYGVYVNGNTIFVLSESEEGFTFAAQEFCRQMYGWKQLTYLSVDSNAIVIDSSMNTFDLSKIENYTTKITFITRDPANGLYKNDDETTNYDKTDFGFTGTTPFSYYGLMHNSLDYFDVHTSGDETKEDFQSKAELWSTAASTAGVTASNAFSTTGDQLCYLGRGDKATFDAMVKHVVTIITAKYNSNNKMKAINFMLEDNSNSCACTYCAKFSNPSVTQTIFLNEVAKSLEAKGVPVAVEFFSYNAYSPAPVLSSTEANELKELAETLGISYETTTVTYDDKVDYYGKLSATTATVLKCEDGLRLWWTSHEANHSFELEHEANAHMYLALQAWIASIGAKNVDVFMYQAAYRNYFFPLNTWEYQILWYQSLNRLGVNNYMFNLGDIHNKPDKQTGFAVFKTYIDSRAMTDVNVTFEELKDEFFSENGYYGAGGPTMRKFFEELVEVYESHKQGGTAQFVATTSFTNNKNTLSTTGNGYIATSYLNDYNASSNPNHYAYARQGFFNGSYGWDLTALLFGARQSKYSNVEPSTNIFVYGKNEDGTDKTQLQTLETWYTYCQTALSMVDADSKYADRIQLEQLMPEYMYLVYYSTYTAGSSSTAPSVTSTFPTAASEVILTDSYQDFYKRVVELGISVPSEFYAFDENGSVPAVYEKKVISYTYRYMYENMFKNWGVSVS